MNFDQYAKTWDTEERISRAKIISKEIGASISAGGNCSAMEFGCGTGLISFNIYDKFKDVILIDSSKGMIDILNSKIDKYKLQNMKAMHIDLCKEDLTHIKFDAIYNSMVLHHISDIPAIIGKLYELLNKDGYICIVDLNEEDGSFHKNELNFKGHNGFNQEKMKDILKNAGFSEVESHTFYNGEKIIDDKKIVYSLFIIRGRK